MNFDSDWQSSINGDYTVTRIKQYLRENPQGFCETKHPVVQLYFAGDYKYRLVYPLKDGIATIRLAPPKYDAIGAMGPLAKIAETVRANLSECPLAVRKAFYELDPDEKLESDK